MRWAALVPLKPAPTRKGRLAGYLSTDDRERLALQLFNRLIVVLGDAPEIEAVHLLSGAKPEGWNSHWLRDEGRGLNAEVEAARFALDAVPLLVIHADLPLVGTGDIAALLAAAEAAGSAIAPDRHGEGTNAVALLPDHPFVFAFGPESFARHRPQAGASVEREGLALDCDIPADLDLAQAAGFSF